MKDTLLIRYTRAEEANLALRSNYFFFSLFLYFFLMFISLQTDQTHNANYLKGMHGYDNQLESMRPIFYAHGRRLKKGYKIEPFDVVNLYPLFCHLLEITPAPNNGSLVKFAHILTDF